MILSSDQLIIKAHELALQHDVDRSHNRLREIRMLHEAVAELRAFGNDFQNGRGHCSQPAQDWLTSHVDFIEEQSVVLTRNLSTEKLRSFTRLKPDGRLRVMVLCTEYLACVDGVISEESFITFIRAFQEVTVLTMGELWVLPLFLRMAVILSLRDVMESVRERREVCAQVDNFLAKVAMPTPQPGMLRERLEQAGQDLPLSGPVIVHLVSHLREWTDDAGTVRDWLVCQLDNGVDTLDQLVAFEHQLQATYQINAGNLIMSLRLVARLNWQDAFEGISLVEQTLREEPTEAYAKLDFTSRDQLRHRVEHLARRLFIPENLVAQHAVILASKALEKSSRESFLAYYLLEPPGIKHLRDSLKMCASPRAIPALTISCRAKTAYFVSLTVLVLFFVVIFCAWIFNFSKAPVWEWIIVVLAVLLPGSEWALGLLNWLIKRTTSSSALLRYDFAKGVPPEATTMVVIPVIWSVPEAAFDMVDRLELHYLANRDPHIHYAILGDFADSKEQSGPEDEQILQTAKQGIERLNTKYVHTGTTFHLFHRHRQWNDAEQMWMGWERKRGKLVEFVDLLKGKQDTSYDFIIGNHDVWSAVRYVITLDMDTQLPIGSAKRMIGTMHLPYNRPRLNQSRTRVVEGYGVLQPRIGIKQEVAERSRFSRVWAGEPGIDPYSFAVFDPYQNALGQGIFAGKGIFEVDSFATVLGERIPENRVLSHDLLEGGFLRAGLLTDIELIDDHPASFYAFQNRLHRWVRGDWQLLLWLSRRARNRRGAKDLIDLTAITRWQIVDNLRRSLLTPSLFIALLLGLTILPGDAGSWAIIVFFTLALPVIRQIASGWRSWTNPKGILTALGQVLISALLLPFQTAMLLDAIVRTLYRLMISKRKLLEWVSSAEVEERDGKVKRPLLMGIPGGYLGIAVFAISAVSLDPSPMKWIGLTLSLLWAFAPVAVYYLDRAPMIKSTVFSDQDLEMLYDLASRIWTFFEEYVTDEENHLPPDNVQIDPPVGVAHRTSPTNIGLYLACIVAARDFGKVSTKQMIDRIERTITTIETLQKWHGHLYNWYDTLTLAPLSPPYVSAVDSGNFVAALVTVKEAVREALQPEKVADLSEPESADLRKTAFSLLTRIERLIDESDFEVLYDHRLQLFRLGYHVNLDKAESIHYDLIASEARLASFLAIALGQVPVSHWFALGRTMTKVGSRPTFLSWSGTMFEFLMPPLLMRTYRNTVWDSTYQAVVMRQMNYAHKRGVAFGISESGYNAFDFQMNYQYRAFGVPGLGFQKGLEDDLVVAPYAAVMALPYAGKRGVDNLRRLLEYGAHGDYGYYEAIDFTVERLPQGTDHAVIKSFMAHHQGMSLLTLANLLLPQKMVDRFHADPRIKAAELLLQERMPAKPLFISKPAAARTRMDDDAQRSQAPALREYTTPHTSAPEVCLMSNGDFLSVITNSGSGYSQCRSVSISRWREDPVTDPWGMYVYFRNVATGRVWSPSYAPCKVEAKDIRIQYGLDKATFMCSYDGVDSSMEVCVAPEWGAEVRRLTLSNTTQEEIVLEITTFVELALAPHDADVAHPSFSKLFVETQSVSSPECLLAKRRPRSDGEMILYAVHALTIGGEPLGPVEYETDRAQFIGRSRTLQNPYGIDRHLSGTVGAVLDPAFVMRRRVTIESGERVQLFMVTGVANERDKAIDLVRRLSTDHQVERTFQMAWTRSQIELSHLHLSSDEAMTFHTLAGRCLYNSSLSPLRAQGIANNRKGQSGLWAHGISGDVPIVMVNITDASEMGFLIQILRGQSYLRQKGFLFDLVVLNQSPGGYQQGLQDAVRRTVEAEAPGFVAGGHGSVFPIATQQLTAADQSLLFAVSRVILQGNGPSLKAQLRTPSRKDRFLPLLSTTTSTAQCPAESLRLEDDSSQWAIFNGFGGFADEGREYRMMLKHGMSLPAPWVNVISNPRFGSLVSERGSGYTWWQNSREMKLTPWRNDPVLDPASEVCYLRDDANGRYWSLTPAPASDDQPYKVSHGWGYSRFEHVSQGVSQEMTVFVPQDDPVKIIRLRLSNHSDVTRRLTVFYYVEWVLGVMRDGQAPFLVTEWDDKISCLTAQNHFQEVFAGAEAFVKVFSADTAVSDHAASDMTYTCDRVEFLGRNRDLSSPDGLKRQKLSGKSGTLSEPCGVIGLPIDINEHAQSTVYILLGSERSHDQVTLLAKKFSDIETIEKEWQNTAEFWNKTVRQIQVNTPCQEMNYLLNGWLLYQTLACRMWARTATYQAGGAYGFRDQLQDSLALLHTRPDLTRAQIVLHASHQFEEGDVEHWWHEETKRGIRTRFSDDLLWLPYAVARYIDHTGDYGLLAKVVPYLHGDPLAEGEDERYGPTVVSEEAGNIYDHCLRAIKRGLAFGEHGLPLMGSGDWNDGLNLVGPKGKGESVWLGWFLCDILEKFVQICIMQEDMAQKDVFQEALDKLSAALSDKAWDGQWYRRAYTDHGQWLGSILDEECRIDAIAQSWAAISGAGDQDKVQRAMQSFERELVDRSLGIARLLTPPFDRIDPRVGYIQGYPPGIRENGGQYTHGVIWGIIAFAILKRGNLAFDLFHLLNPVTHTHTPNEVRRYAGEPYVMAADVYSSGPHAGRAGWTWYTGAAGWMYQAGVEWILGIKRRQDRLYIEPCIPSEWPEFHVTYRVGQTSYEITVNNPDQKESGWSSLEVDGQIRTSDSNRSPFTADASDHTNEAQAIGVVAREKEESKAYIDLHDDGQAHQVVLTM